MTYRIVRMFSNEGHIFIPSEVVKTGLTLEAARAHCKDPDTSSSSCTTDEGNRRTIRRGPWMDGYESESKPVRLWARPVAHSDRPLELPAP